MAEIGSSGKTSKLRMTSRRGLISNPNRQIRQSRTFDLNHFFSYPSDYFVGFCGIKLQIHFHITFYLDNGPPRPWRDEYHVQYLPIHITTTRYSFSFLLLHASFPSIVLLVLGWVTILDGPEIDGSGPERDFAGPKMALACHKMVAEKFFVTFGLSGAGFGCCGASSGEKFSHSTIDPTHAERWGGSITKSTETLGPEPCPGQPFG